MRKILLSMAAVLMSLAVSAQDGITVVGANIPILPSARWSKVPYTAKVLVVNPDIDYGNYGDDNVNYNMELLEDYSVKDTNGKAWYEKGYDLTTTVPDDYLTTEDGYFKWEDQTAPFSSDETWNGMKSFQWTRNNIIADIFIRRTFTTNMLLAGDVYLACGHDDAPCEYYLNGVLIWQKTGYEVDHYDYVVDPETGDTLSATPRYKQGWNNDEYYKLTDEQKELILTNGEENLLACHVHQNWGGAFADCGLYTMLEGGLDMGYVRPWEGKVIFNSTGGYNNDGRSPSNNPKHPWSELYAAQQGDVYSFTMPGNSDPNSDDDAEWMEQLHFKTPIPMEQDKSYTVKFTFQATSDYSAVRVKMCDNDNDEEEATAYDDFFQAYADTPFDFEQEIVAPMDINNFKLVFDFGGGEANSTIQLSNISIVDEDNNELWVGSQFFTYFDMHKRVVKLMVWDDTLNDGAGGYREAKTDEEKESYEYEEIAYEGADAPVIEGLNVTMDWTLPEFDDSKWDSQMMPTGSAGYMPEQQSVWPSGIGACYGSSNYWIRRNFELDKINDRLSYELNVCHDDVYETYVNGVRLQKNVGWTDGKHPVQVHIPARYLRVGKNVIATYIQQNWGGYFYDCGINVTEVDINECTKLFNDAVDYAKTDTLLTNRMHKDVDAIIAKAQQFYNENKNDAAELRSFARDSVRPQTNAIFAYSAKVKTLKDTYDLCAKMQDTGYWGTALKDAAAALDTCATSGQIDPYITSLRNARKATAMERHSEKYVGCVPEVVDIENAGMTPLDDPELPRYFIYNVGAKLFLGGGESWGAHAALEYASNAMMLVQAMRDVYEDEEIVDEEPIEGAFYVETFRPNGGYGAGDFLGWNGYVDVPMNSAWELIPVEGKPNVYNIAQYGQTFAEGDTTCYNGTIFQPGGKKLLGLRSGDNAYAPSFYVVDTDLHSPELETNQWMFISREELLNLIPTATEENPVDLTFLIENPGYDQRLSIEAWMFSNGNVWGRGADHQNFVLESYNTSEFSNCQDIWPEEAELALPAGTYKLKVQGYYRDGIEQAHVEKVIKHEPISQRSKVFAGPSLYTDDPESCETIPLMPIHIEANMVPGIGYTYGGMSMPGTYSGQPMSACEQAANEYFQYGLYWNELSFIIPEEDPGHVAIGVVKEADEGISSGDWIVMDNWRLLYYGSEADPDAIGDVIKTPVQTSKDIFNLAGQKLKKVQKGVNIINGKKVLR